MKTTAEYLDEAKASLQVESDNQMAIRLDISRQAISQYRNGFRAFDNFTAMQIAKATGIPLDVIITDMEMQRETNEKRREAWGNYMKRLGGIAATVVISSLCVLSMVVEKLIHVALLST